MCVPTLTGECGWVSVLSVGGWRRCDAVLIYSILSTIRDKRRGSAGRRGSRLLD